MEQTWLTGPYRKLSNIKPKSIHDREKKKGEGWGEAERDGKEGTVMDVKCVCTGILALVDFYE